MPMAIPPRIFPPKPILASRLIYLTSNHDARDPLKCGWTARWAGRVETGRTIGEAVDRIVRHSPDGRIERLALVVREGHQLSLELK